jgi:hypothetical protein
VLGVRRGNQLGAVCVRERVGWGEQDDVVRPLPDDLGVPDHVRAVPKDSELPVAHLPAVAVRAVQHAAGPPVAKTWDVGELVAQPVATRVRRAPTRSPSARRIWKPGPAHWTTS